MSLFRRLQGHRKNHQHHGSKDDPVEMSTSASDGNSPEKQQEHKQEHSALHLGSKNSKQKSNGVEGDNNNTKGTSTSSAPLTPQQQPQPPVGSASKRSSGRSLFKKRRHQGVSTSPTRATSNTTASKEDNDVTNNDDKKNGGKEDYNKIKYGGGGGGVHLSNFHATTSAHAHLPAHHHWEDGAPVVAFYPSSKTPSRSVVVNHLPPTPEAVPLNMELQFPTGKFATPTSSSTAAALTPPKSASRAPTSPTPRKSKATLAASLPRSPRAAAAAPANSAAPPAPLPPPRSALADVAASYAEKSARLAAHKAHWWSLFSHPPHRRHNKKRSNGSSATTTAAAASSLPPRSSPMSRNNSVYSPTSASSGSSPQHVLILTADSDLLNNPDYRNKIAKEAAALDKEGNEFFQQGNYDDAFLCYEKAMTLKRQSLYVTNQQMMKEGEQEDQGDDDDASVASQVTVNSKASILASVATSINNMTYLKQRAGLATAEETMAAYLKSLQIKREILGPNHLSVGKTLNNIGSVFYIKREFEPALTAYQSAHEIMAAQLGTEHLDVGTVISNIGDVKAAMETGDGSNKQDAMEYYRRALDIRWKALGPNDPKVIRLMEQLAWLETGKQPQKLDEELSDSEDEEFATEDRKRHEAFQEDVRVLQDELAEDMKFFDLLERKMAIDMVKDKTRCFRELRELQEELDLNNNNNSASHHGTAAAATAETTDNADGSDAILTTVSASPNMAAAAAACDFQATSEVKKIGNFVDRSHNNNSDQQQHPSPSLSSFSSPSGNEHEIRPTPPEMRKGKLTDKERKEALTSVRARLAALRASRDPNESDVTENDDDDDTGKLSVSVNSEDNKKCDRNEVNSDWLRKQHTQALQQYHGSPSSLKALEDGLEELTREINAGSFRTSTSPGVLSSSLPGASENPVNKSSDDDECSGLQSKQAAETRTWE